MKNKISKIICLLMALVVIALSLFASLTVKAETSDFTMKEFDKAYITFVFDDGEMPFSKECYEIFKDFKMPMCCALVADKVRTDKETAEFFKEIELAGCEILSHTLSHDVLHKDNCSLTNVEKQIGDSFKVLTSLGFTVNGIIEVGDDGRQATANYNLIETVTRKYYKYSNAYGVSPQYKKERIWLKDNTLASIKLRIDNAISEKEWMVISAHDFTEFSKNNMTELLSYIASKGASKVKVATWDYVYKNFGVYTGEKIPSKEIMESVCESFGHDIKNGKINKEATCTENAIATGECDRCGKNGTYEVAGTAAHKFGKYEKNTIATCQELGTLIAKCTVEGCNGTSVIQDSKNGYKEHIYRAYTVKVATTEESGIAENRCESCSKVKNTIIIPKGKTLYDVLNKEDFTSSVVHSSREQSSDTASDSKETESSEVTSSEEEEENTVEEMSDFDNDFDQDTLTTVLIIIVIVVCLASWIGIGFFVYKIIKNRNQQ